MINPIILDISEQEFYEKAFSRNIGILTLEEQQKLKNTRVAIAGLGGVGGIYMLSLTRIGIGKFNVADFDDFSVENVNRQAGADTTSFGHPKVATMERKAKEINPYISVKVFPNGVTEENVDDFLKDVDIVLDGIDFFTVDARLILYRAAREKGIYVIASAPVGFGSTLLVFDPKGMTFEKYFDISTDMPQSEKLIRFGLGVAPMLLQRKYFKPESINFKTKKVSSNGLGTLLCAGIVSCEILKIILGRGRIDVIPVSSQFDTYLKKYKKINLRFGNRAPYQRFKIWYFRRTLKKAGQL